MEKSVLDITDSLRHKKQGLKTSYVRDVEGKFVVKLRAQNIDSHFLNTQLPLNEDDNNNKEQFELYELQENSEKISWYWLKNSYHTSDDVFMLGYECGMSQYPQFFVEDLDMYQMLPRSYLRPFDYFRGDKLKKMGVRLGKSSRNICLGIY